jgi:hypothetical protein
MSSKLTVAPYGAWKSPISIDHVAGESLTFKEIHVNVSKSTLAVCNRLILLA